MRNIWPSILYLNENTQKEFIRSKVKSLALYGSQVLLGQSQSTFQRACALLMRINRYMTSNPLILRSNEAISNFLNVDLPKQELIKTAFKNIHKIVKSRKPQHIINELHIPNRKSSKIYTKSGKQTQRSGRSPLNAAIDLYNAMPSHYKVMDVKKVKKNLKKVNISYKLFN